MVERRRGNIRPSQVAAYLALDLLVEGEKQQLGLSLVLLGLLELLHCENSPDRESAGQGTVPGKRPGRARQASAEVENLLATALAHAALREGEPAPKGLDQSAGLSQPGDSQGDLSDNGRKAAPGPAIEPLSLQEKRVLRLLATGLSYQEIAQELVVSINTVKTHVKNVYRKLNVSRRREARAVARQMDLL